MSSHASAVAGSSLRIEWLLSSKMSKSDLGISRWISSENSGGQIQSFAAVMFVPAVNVPADNKAFPLMSNVAGAVNVPLVIVRSVVWTVVVLPPVFKI